MPATESSVITRFVRGAQQAPILDAEHGIETQVVVNPLTHHRRSRVGYLVAALLGVAAVAVAAIAVTRTTATADSTAASHEAAASAPAPSPAPSLVPAPDPVPVVIAMPDPDPQPDLAAGEPAAAPAPAVEPAPPAVEPAPPAVEHAPAPAPGASAAGPRPRPYRRVTPRSTAAPRAKRATPAAIAGDKGVLMISSKPPCRIYVNGSDTGLTTPQRAIKLKRGRYKISLVNREFGLEHELSVEIQPGAKVRVVRDLTGKMK